MLFHSLLFSIITIIFPNGILIPQTKRDLKSLCFLHIIKKKKIILLVNR
jgi:hypothetical protein